MDFSEDKKECIIFDGDEIAMVPRRGRIPIPWRIAIWLACGLVIGSVWLFKSGGITDGDGGGLGDNGTFESERQETDRSSEGFLTEETKFDETQPSNDGETTGYEVESSDFGESSDGAMEKNDVFAADLSYAERGDGYFYNYSDRDPDVEGLLEMGFAEGREYYSERPVVLIIHSHIKEGYCDFDSSNATHSLTKSVLTVGERVAYELNRRGVPTVHCTVIHGEGEGGAYGDAAETIAEMLKIYPTIEYVIDLHRLDDRDGEGRILKTESAVGCGQIRLTASSDGEFWEENLSLALALRKELNSGDRRLCLPVVFTDVKLNAKSAPRYLKIDVGASGNSTAEAVKAGEYLARALAEILKK